LLVINSLPPVIVFSAPLGHRKAISLQVTLAVSLLFEQFRRCELAMNEFFCHLTGDAQNHIH
jgi:hypothetical protein